MLHVMLDLETYGTQPGCIIRSIGAISFKMTRKGCRELGRFYVNVQEADQVAAGLTKDPDTVAWWKKQSKAAQEALLVDQVPFVEAAKRFRAFVSEQRCDGVWSQGSTFDPPILSEAFSRFGLDFPFKFSKYFDTRTAYLLAKLQPWTIPSVGTHHNALDDCAHQIKCLHASMRRIYVDLAL